MGSCYLMALELIHIRYRYLLKDRLWLLRYNAAFLVFGDIRFAGVFLLCTSSQWWL